MIVMSFCPWKLASDSKNRFYDSCAGSLQYEWHSQMQTLSACGKTVTLALFPE